MACYDKVEALFIKANEDKALAATEEVVVDGETAKAVGEQEQVVAYFANAGSLQMIVDADRIEAVADSAARKEKQ